MTKELFLQEDERVDDLQIQGLQIIQNTKKFCFGMDAVLLANFAAQEVGHKDSVVDLGTGTGIIPLLLWGKAAPQEIIGLEIQKDMVEMARRSIRLNDLQDTIKIMEGDIKSPPAELMPNYYDAVVTNPPYMEGKSGLKNSTEGKTISRHEILCTLEDIIKSAKRVLKSRGKIYMIHRSQRLVDIMYLMRQANMEPKRIRFIHPSKDKDSNLVLIQAVKGGKAQMTIEKPLYVYQEEGDYTQEIYDIYQWKKDRL